MDIRLEKEFFDELESDFEDSRSKEKQQKCEEDLKKFDETIKYISRNLRKGDWAYLNRHPEIRAITRVIVTEAIRKHPEDIFKFTAKLFHCNNHKKLTKKINKQLKWVNKQVRANSWSPADGEMLFPESSTSSINRPNCDNELIKESSDYEEFLIQQNKCPDNLKPT